MKSINTYSLKVLQNALDSERKSLREWNCIVESNDDALAVRQANGNVPSCEARIRDLESTIATLTETKAQ